MALNETSVKIDKKNFFELITTRKFIPVRGKTVNANEQHKLYKLAPTTNKDIALTIKPGASTHFKYYNMEG